jgi:polyribonucleotide nucleotidyltransferase
MYNAVYAAAAGELSKVYQIADKTSRQDADDKLKDATKTNLAAQFDETVMGQFSAAYKSVTKKIVRDRVLKEGIRMDGRGLRDIRPITAEIHVVPRVHGSAIFERGETQIMGITTLNMLKMEQQIDALSPVKSKRYMHNYNFPPYSTGETGRVGTPKRREIGHGALAERALVPVLPARDEFPYAIGGVSPPESLGTDTEAFGVVDRRRVRNPYDAFVRKLLERRDFVEHQDAPAGRCFVDGVPEPLGARNADGESAVVHDLIVFRVFEGVGIHFYVG